MKITVLGANGRVGRLVVTELLKRGYDVQAFVHSVTLAEKPGLTNFQGDIMRQEDIETAITGSDAVISCLGSWGTKDKNILTRAMTYLVPAMEQAGIAKLVTLTGNAAAYPGEHFSLAMQTTKAFLNTLAPKILRDSEDHMALLAASKLDYTVLRSPAMIGFRSITYSLSAHPAAHKLTISRQAVVIALCDLLVTDDWIHQYPCISRT